MVEIIDNSLRWVRSESHLVTNYPYALTLPLPAPSDLCCLSNPQYLLALSG